MKKKILMVLNYYYPYISGLSEVARLLAERYVAEGNEVTVLCSNHDHLAPEEMVNGVRVVRAPVWFKISKGTVSPAFITRAIRMAKQADVVNMHLPMLESGIISAFVKKSKLCTSYHCDIDLEKGLLNRIIKSVMNFMNNWGLKNSAKILVTSIDYGSHSRLASKYPEKLVEVRTPIKEYFPVVVDKPAGVFTIGFCGRIVMEKGIDVLLKAYRLIRQQRSDVRLVIGGDYQNVAGGSIYPQLEKYIEQEKLENVHFLGKIAEEEMATFYSSLDVFVLPSINPLEAFGMVQVEAMYCGVPVVASDLYGVRTIVSNTGMGLVHKKGDAEDLARCIIEVLEKRDSFVKDRKTVHDLYSTDRCADDYEACFDAVIEAAGKENGK